MIAIHDFSRNQGLDDHAINERNITNMTNRNPFRQQSVSYEELSSASEIGIFHPSNEPGQPLVN